MTSKESGIQSFVELRESDVSPESPRMSIELSASPRFSLTLPYQIKFTLRRAHHDARDCKCIVRWTPAIDAFSPSGLVLLRHVGEGGFEVVAVDHAGVAPLPGADIISVNGPARFLWELAPGTYATFVDNPPERYYRALRANETYTLLYPGTEQSMWEWGSVEDNIGSEVRRDATTTPGHRLVISGGASVTFTAQSEEVPWPDRAKAEASRSFALANLEEHKWRLSQIKRKTPSPVGISERLSGTAALTVTLTCAATVPQKGQFLVTMNVKHDGIVGQADTSEARAVIFHTEALISPRGRRHGFRLYRSRDQGRNWERCNLNDSDVTAWAGPYADDPDLVVSVAADNMKEHFVSLRLGEEWTREYSLQGSTWSCLPEDSVPGDIFRYSFTGTAVEWWDWGTRDEHKDTFVSLPAWIHGYVTEPRDNRGRDALVVPASEVVEFVMVE